MNIKELFKKLKPWQKGLFIGFVLDILIYLFRFQLFNLSNKYVLVTIPYMINLMFRFPLQFIPIIGHYTSIFAYTIYGFIIGSIITKLKEKT